jgi:GT2 family glycosyltransferase
MTERAGPPPLARSVEHAEEHQHGDRVRRSDPTERRDSAHDAADVLPAQLDALVRQNDDDHWEIVVVDNASHDDTADVVRRYAAIYPRISLVAAHAASNASYARNEGAKAARGTLLAFLDADDVVALGWVAAMIAALEGEELVAGALEYDRLNPPWAVDVRGVGQQDGFFYLEGGPAWPIAFAANMGVSRRRHDEVGGFDEALPWGGEDADYAWRLQALGVTPGWAPDALVHYRLRTSLPSLYRQAVGYARSRWELHHRYAESGRFHHPPCRRRSSSSARCSGSAGSAAEPAWRLDAGSWVGRSGTERVPRYSATRPTPIMRNSRGWSRGCPGVPRRREQSSAPSHD